MPSDAENLITFLHMVGRLKDTPRTGWVDYGIPQPESISDHMYRMSLMCMMCPDETLDRHYMIKMALCHDVGECIVGDISPAMKVPAAEKQRREIEAIAELRSLVPHRDGEEEQKANATPSFGDELQALFLAYEKQETPEAKFVKDMDLLEMIVQAHAYEAANPGKDLGSFFNSGAKIQHPWAKAIFQQLLDTRPFLTNQMKL